MRQILTIAAVPLLLAACGRSDEEKLEDAANQSHPEAAQILEGAAENGMDPQEALARAGNAVVENESGNQRAGNLRARPNTAQNPNPAAPGQPVESVPANQIDR